MKKAMKIILPILLSLAVIGCMIWYLFVYDRDFTRDLLLSQARRFERNGNHAMAEWLYDKAYSQANQDEDVAIELAQQYKSSGNYTKAEYTLSNAIADGGTAKLYIALCQTYVEQDKLLDAVDMLNNIADPAIKAELDALRPAAPSADPDPGFYSEYICVSISAESGVLYTTTDGEYPSTSDTPYSEPITLPAGETVIYALAVADNGLVSPLSIFGYTIGGVIEEVSFTDPAIEASIRRILNVDDDKILFTNDLWEISEFVMPQDAQTYVDLSLLPYLHSLTIENSSLDELQFLSGLSTLEELTLVNCRPSDEDLEVIASLPQLQKLTMRDCELSTIEPLANSQKLTYLDLSGNNLRNISALSNMADLQELNLASNAVNDLSALAGLSNLSKLDVSFNSLASIAPISASKALTWLDASNNGITSLNSIDNLTNLTYLSVSYNRLSDVSVLSGCTALKELDISNNSLTDISSLSSLTKLTNFNFSYNQVTALPELRKDCALVIIDGSHNLLSSLETLAGMGSLNKVLMDYNEEISSVNELSSCPNLYQVSVFGTKVTDASVLTDMSIIVNYDPTAAFEE